MASRTRNRLNKYHLSFFVVLIAYLCLVLFLASGCTTAKKCADKFPCVETQGKTDTQFIKVENPNAKEIDSLKGLIKPCPDFEFEKVEIPTAIEQHNEKVLTTNKHNKKALTNLANKCKDSIQHQLVTKRYYLIDKVKNDRLNYLEEANKKTSWHLSRIYDLNKGLILSVFFVGIILRIVILKRNR